MKKTILAIMVIILLGGCSMGKEYTYAEITAGGVIDVKKARASGYVTYEETANDIITGENKKAQKYIKENYTELEKHAKEVIEESIGREVEIIGINGNFPYMAASINFKTTTFPIIFETTAVGLEDSLQLNRGGYKEIDEPILHYRTVSSLYMYAFEEELNEMRTYFSNKNPSYTSSIIPSKDADYNTIEYPFIETSIQSPGQEDHADFEKNFLKKVYDTYWKNPEMSKQELRELFEQQPKILLEVDIVAYETDLTKIPTEDEAKAIQKDFKEYKYYWANSKYLDVRVFIGTNLRKKGSLEPLYRESLYI